MNNDFEDQLIALASNTVRPDPTPAWRTQILARARSEAASASPPPRRRKRAPMLVGAAAWLAIIAMWLTLPEESQDASTPPASSSPEAIGPSAFLTEDQHPPTLYALQLRWEQHLELP